MTVANGASTLSGSEIRRRALRGTIALVGRSTALRAIGLLTNLILTRILAPKDFGTLAIGLTTLSLAGLFVAGGLGAALLRRREPPARAELEGILALQLALGTGIAAVIAAATLPLGRVGVVTTLMVWVLPISALRTPGIVLTEREMQYGPIVVAEVLETFVYAVAAICLALAGLGVYGVAAAAILRAIVGSAYILGAVPGGRVWPRWRWPSLRPLLRFGAQFQAASLVDVGRDESLNIGVAALGSLTVLGFWGLAQRVLQIPFLLFEALWRVSFPAVARMIDAGEDVKELLGRTAASLAIGVGVVLVPLAASSWDLVPLAFGHEWLPAASSVALPCLGLLLSGPVSVISAGFLYAQGDARTVLFAMVVSALATVGCSLVIVGVAGKAWGPGVGMLVGTLVESVVFLQALRRHEVQGVGARTAIPAAIGAAAAAAGWAASRAVSSHVLGAAAAIAISVGIYVAALALVQRSSLQGTLRLSRRAFAPSDADTA